MVVFTVALTAEDTALSFTAFPRAHCAKLRTNNVQERANREIKRRYRVVPVSYTHLDVYKRQIVTGRMSPFTRRESPRLQN